MRAHAGCGTLPDVKETIKKMLEDARSAAAFARRTRERHGKQTDRDSPQRIEDIELALARIREAMQPLRTEIGRFPYGAQTDAAERVRDRIRAASAALQSERRKLWKMKPRR